MKTLRRIIKDQRTKVALAMTAGLVLLAGWLSAVDRTEILARLSTIDLRYMGLFAILWASAAFLRSLRWRVILSKMQAVPPLESFALFMSCMFVNFLIPLRLGEAVAGLALKRNRGVPFAKSLPTQVMDRLFDLTPIVPAIVLVLLMGGEGSGSIMAILLFVVAVFTLLSAMVLISMSRPAAGAAIIRTCARALPRGIRARVEPFAVRCMEGLGALRLGTTTIIALVGVTFLALTIDAVSLAVIFRGLGYWIDPAVVLAGYTLFFLMSALPRPPGQVGSHEVLFLLIFSLLLGIDKNVASAAVVVGHVMLALLLTATGSISLFALGIRSISTVRENISSVTIAGASQGGGSHGSVQTTS